MAGGRGEGEKGRRGASGSGRGQMLPANIYELGKFAAQFMFTRKRGLGLRV